MKLVVRVVVRLLGNSLHAMKRLMATSAILSRVAELVLTERCHVVTVSTPREYKRSRSPGANMGTRTDSCDITSRGQLIAGRVRAVVLAPRKS